MPEPKTNQTPDDQKTGYEDKPTDELKALIESEQDAEAQKKLNREIFNRAKRAEEALKAGAGKKDPAENGGTSGQPAADKVQISYEDGLALQAEGLSPAEILEMAKIAKRMGVSPVEAYHDPIIKAGFESTRKKDRVASQTLPPSGRVSGGVAERSQDNPNDTPGMKAGRAAFNRRLARNPGGEE